MAVKDREPRVSNADNEADNGIMSSCGCLEHFDGARELQRMEGGRRIKQVAVQQSLKCGDDVDDDDDDDVDADDVDY